MKKEKKKPSQILQARQTFDPPSLKSLIVSRFRGTVHPVNYEWKINNPSARPECTNSRLFTAFSCFRGRDVSDIIKWCTVEEQPHLIWMIQLIPLVFHSATKNLSPSLSALLNRKKISDPIVDDPFITVHPEWKIDSGTGLFRRPELFGTFDASSVFTRMDIIRSALIQGQIDIPDESTRWNGNCSRLATFFAAKLQHIFFYWKNLYFRNIRRHFYETNVIFIRHKNEHEINCGQQSFLGRNVPRR